jgi:hypothetical protein
VGEPVSDFSQKEYELLRAELDRHVDETVRLERYAVAGVVAFFAWLLKEVPASTELDPWAWYVPVLLPLLGGLRSLALYAHIGVIAGYLNVLEQQLYGLAHQTKGGTLGWESYLNRPSRGKGRGVVAAGTWVLLLSGTVAFGRSFAGGWPTLTKAPLAILSFAAVISLVAVGQAISTSRAQREREGAPGDSPVDAT